LCKISRICRILACRSFAAAEFDDAETRTRFIAALRRDGVNSVFHYVPLHSAPAGRKFARTSGSLSVTQSVSDRLTRLPLWLGLEAQQDYVIERCRHALAR